MYVCLPYIRDGGVDMSQINSELYFVNYWKRLLKSGDLIWSLKWISTLFFLQEKKPLEIVKPCLINMFPFSHVDFGSL